jgi:LacI family transcriptional regulator
LSDWLSRLPKPAGLMVCTDDCAMEFFSAAGDVNLRIPQDLAVVGSGNDVMVCDFSNPPLSSVKLNLEESGFRAAQRLHEMIRGRRAAGHITVKAFDVVDRQSSNYTAVEDDLVAQALQYIHARRGTLIRVKDVVDALPISRRALYRKFKQQLGRSVAREIRHAHMNQAARMLVDTSVPVSEIAETLGYDAVQNFSRSFSREKGVTPRKYRNQNALLR